MSKAPDQTTDFFVEFWLGYFLPVEIHKQLFEIEYFSFLAGQIVLFVDSGEFVDIFKLVASLLQEDLMELDLSFVQVLERGSLMHAVFAHLTPPR